MRRNVVWVEKWKAGEFVMTLTNYWWLLIWLFTGGVFLAFCFPQQKECVCGKEEKRWKKISAVILALPYIIWAGFRADYVGDTYNYRRAFLEAPDSISAFSEYMSGIIKDKGFYALTAVIKSIISNSDIVYFLILASFQILVVVFVVRKYSCDYWFSMFVFIATTDYLSWTWNGVRQFTAVTLIFSATSLIISKRYVPLVIIVLLASTIHGSALLMLPVVYIIQGKAWNKKTVLCIIASIVALIFVNQFTDILGTLLAETQYTNVVSDWQSFNDDGTNPIRVLVYSVPTILSLIGLKYIRIENNPLINMATNASILTAALGIISIGTSGIFLGRIPIFVSLWANLILLPWEIENFFTKESAKIIKFLAVMCYIAFFYFQLHFTWGLL